MGRRHPLRQARLGNIHAQLAAIFRASNRQSIRITDSEEWVSGARAISLRIGLAVRLGAGPRPLSRALSKTNLNQATGPQLGGRTLRQPHQPVVL